MPAPLEFYFDFSSPYGYVAAMRIDQIAAKHGRGVEWKPMLLGAVFKVAGSQPLTEFLASAGAGAIRLSPGLFADEYRGPYSAIRAAQPLQGPV